MKILYLWGHSNPRERELIRAELNSWINQGYEITPINYLEEIGINNLLPYNDLDLLYSNKYQPLIDFYKKIYQLSKSHDVLITNYGNVLHPDFVRSLNEIIYTVLVSGDDPIGSEICSKHYVSSFDYCFAYSTRFDATTTVIDKFKEWGAKKADWWPYGFREDMYDSSLTENDVLTKDRPIDIVFVGTPWMKEDRLIQLKEMLPQIQMYGQRYLQTFIKHFLNSHDTRSLKMIFVKELPADRLVPLYQQSKIGINMAVSHETGNLRTYQLPANGIMQICDNIDGLNEIFKEDEVVPYSNTEHAVKLINYYLNHDNERKQIAVAGFKRAMKDYKSLTTFNNALMKIEGDKR